MVNQDLAFPFLFEGATTAIVCNGSDSRSTKDGLSADGHLTNRLVAAKLAYPEGDPADPSLRPQDKTPPSFASVLIHALAKSGPVRSGCPYSLTGGNGVIDQSINSAAL